MQEEQFHIFEKEILDRAQQNLVSKANRDYGVAEDKLFNFHSAAPILGSPELVCLSYATKHFMSIAKYTQEKKTLPKDLALEKVGDMISYMVIMYALMRERELKENPETKLPSPTQVINTYTVDLPSMKNKIRTIQTGGTE